MELMNVEILLVIILFQGLASSLFMFFFIHVVDQITSLIGCSIYCFEMTPNFLCRSIVHASSKGLNAVGSSSLVSRHDLSGGYG